MIRVAEAVPDDLPNMVKLFQEIDAFYSETVHEPAEVKMEQINSVLFASLPLAHALLAHDGPDVIGLAAYSFLWPAALTTKSLYLKELYVTESRRRDGVGKMLMRRIFEIAADNGCSRVEWVTDEDNEQAQKFYGKLGFRTISSKVFYRAEGHDVINAVRGRQSTP